MPPVGFEPTVSAGDRPQTYALDRAATGIDSKWRYGDKITGEIGMAWHAVSTGKTRNVQRILVANVKGKRSTGRSSHLVLVNTTMNLLIASNGVTS